MITQAKHHYKTRDTVPNVSWEIKFLAAHICVLQWKQAYVFPYKDERRFLAVLGTVHPGKKGRRRHGVWGTSSSILLPLMVRMRHICASLFSKTHAIYIYTLKYMFRIDVRMCCQLISAVMTTIWCILALTFGEGPARPDQLQEYFSRKWKCVPPQFIRDVDEFVSSSVSQQWLLCSEWVPSEWESD